MKKILVVDDEPTVLFALSEALTDKRRGWKVVTARDGREAISILESDKIHLVVTDLRMPEVDGFELLAHLRRTRPELPVIVMTALGHAETSGRLDPEGVLECLSKPFDVAVLQRKIHEKLAQRVTGRVENISLASFLQLLEMERKTCTLSITAGEHTGRLYFRSGRLVGAETGGLAGSEAALEIVTWEHTDIEISEICALEGPPLPGGLPFLLLEAMRLADERSRAGASDEEAELDALLSTELPAAGAPPVADSSELVREALDRGRGIEGTLATVLASAAALRTKPVDLEGAAAAAAELMRRREMVEEKLGRQPVEEMLLATHRRWYLVRPLGVAEDRFLLMILDRRKADLSLAQSELAAMARDLAERVPAS
jgi:CheY-like chemotaxis protein/predicted regulator of Ras-like GTPase activity (Roadblock/LC7/MglB family)